MDQLSIQLSTLALLRDLLSDPTLRALQQHLQAPAPATYAAFVSSLYAANGGDLSAHILSLLEDSENVYVRTLSRGAAVPQHLQDALLSELSILQAAASLTPESLSRGFEHSGYLPGFISSPLNIPQVYLARMQDIGRWGYGIWAKNTMFSIDDVGQICPILHPDPVTLADLVDYERERSLVLQNTRALLQGLPAANILLSGDAGTGKSSTVKAVLNGLAKDGLRLVEVRKDQLRHIPHVLSELSQNPLKFILFIDDLSFLKDDDNFNALKAVLEGSATARSKNVAIYATSNRRHIIKETFSDRAGDEIHRNDTMQEFISLSERFGLHVTFQKPDKKTYLHIVEHLAAEAGLAIGQEELFAGAERFALGRSGRSARLARQYVDSLLSQDFQA